MHRTANGCWGSVEAETRRYRTDALGGAGRSRVRLVGFLPAAQRFRSSLKHRFSPRCNLGIETRNAPGALTVAYESRDVAPYKAIAEDRVSATQTAIVHTHQTIQFALSEYPGSSNNCRNTQSIHSLAARGKPPIHTRPLTS